MLDKHANYSSGKVSYTAAGPIRMTSDKPESGLTVGAVLAIATLFILITIACYLLIGF